MESSKHEENGTDMTKPSTSLEKNGTASYDHPKRMDVEKGQTERKGSTSLAMVGKAFQFLARSMLMRKDRSEIVDSQNEFLKKFGMNSAVRAYADEGPPDPSWKGKLKNLTVHPSGDLHYSWVTIMTVAILYNSITIVMRAVFNEFQDRYYFAWYTADYFCDFLYLLDIAVVFRTGYLEQGLLVRDFKKLASYYVRGTNFKLDILSILPTDLLYLISPETDNVAVRINRLFRLHRAFEFIERTETRTRWPNAFRISCLITYIVIIIHWNGCIYFAVSKSIGLGTDQYVYNDSDPYDSLTRRYITSFYWSTLSLTTIGETKPPVTDAEHMFNIIDYFVGVLIFASIVGNVGSMITNMNATRTEFQNRMDAVKQYMGFQKVGQELENRVIKWFDYLWSNKQSINDDSILETLPDRLRAEIAIHVHFETLRKVRIFQDCEAGLLAEMVLKLRLQVFSPGDFICRKGDIGKEMYIVKQGKLHVVSEDGHTVFATLSEGAVFGELSILNIPGNKTGNRRTANVQSVGYSDLFALSKDDLWDALKEYPEAKKMLIQRGREILKKDNLLDENASEEPESLEEKTDRLDTVTENLQTRFAKLIAEYTNTHRKMMERIKHLDRKLEKYKNMEIIDAMPQIESEKRIGSSNLINRTPLIQRTGSNNESTVLLIPKRDRQNSYASVLNLPSLEGDF